MVSVCRYYKTCPIMTGKMPLDKETLSAYKAICCREESFIWEQSRGSDRL